MLQTERKKDDDELRPYLRAAHVQPNGVLDFSVEPHEMWFTRHECEQLDLREGDAVVVEGGVGGYGRAAYVPWDLPGIGFQNSILRLRGHSAADGRYLAHALVAARNSGQIEMACLNAAMPHFTAEKLARFRVPFHDSGERERIADYLDRETGEIDAMLGRLEELAEHLQLRKATVGSRIFSMGFDCVKLKWLLVEIDERAGEHGADLPLLSVSIHHGVQLRDESSSKQRASADLSNYKVARSGEIVLNRMRAFQGGLGQARVDGLVSPDYSVLRPQGRLSPSWAEYVMRSPEFIGLMSQRLRGIGSADQGNVRTPRINVRDLVDLAIPLPPDEEQQRVIAELDEATTRVDAMLAKVADLKALLLERRAALITDVVTGRKEVA
ncbi:hypothetical protein [Tsukamurella tyrosinosolvens]|uniref:hypothetical protein n=1 Tax=Tsukamurella tyrosinosolvens TaxID=57704 RepID=UPI003F49C416